MSFAVAVAPSLNKQEAKWAIVLENAMVALILSLSST